MNTKITILVVTILIFVRCQPMEETDTAEVEGYVENGIEWEGEDETANYLAMDGLIHYSNVEFDKAFILWDHAVQVDSTLFAPHTMLALMSEGEKKEYHENMARKFVEDKNETSKKFVTILDLEGEEAADQRAELWEDLHEMSNGPWIHYMYAWTLNDSDDQSAMLEELDKVIEISLNELDNEEFGQSLAGACYNIKGYLIQQSGGDLNEAVDAIEKYVELYPGHNAVDSRAEFYLYEGDTAMAMEWYQKVLDMYPYSVNAANNLEELRLEEADTTESMILPDTVEEDS